MLKRKYKYAASGSVSEAFFIRLGVAWRVGGTTNGAARFFCATRIS
jgi:hypothetical protein